MISLFICYVFSDHAGFEVSANTSCHWKNQEHLFNLDGQLKHKFELIYNYLLKKNSKIHLIGHSIGAWMIIELCHKNKKIIQRLSSVNLLFPTIHKMVQSRNGWIVDNIYRRVWFLILLLCMFVNFLPRFIIKYVIKLYLSIQSIPYTYIDIIYKLIHPEVIEKVLFLAFNEMDTVKALNVQGIEKIQHMTNVIYGFNDNWAPPEYMDELKIFEPHLQLQGVNVDHAFVLRSSEKIANMVSDFINLKKSRK